MKSASETTADQRVRKGKVFRARRSTSISGLVTGHIEVLVGEEEA